MALDLDRMIEEVEGAIHDYYTGKSVVRVRIDGEESEFSRVNIDKLEAYLTSLQARKARRPTVGAIGFVW